MTKANNGMEKRKHILSFNEWLKRTDHKPQDLEDMRCLYLDRKQDDTELKTLYHYITGYGYYPAGDGFLDEDDMVVALQEYDEYLHTTTYYKK